MSDLAKRISELPLRKRKLFEQLMTSAARSDRPDASEVERTERAEPLPLSYAQERMWFLHRLDGGTAVYNMPAAIRITGTLKIKILRQVISEIVRRHEVLRTAFVVKDHGPCQVIREANPIRLDVIALERDGANWEEAVKELALAEAQTPFDLEREPLLRARLLQLSAEDHVLLLCMHHIVSDGWSIGVFVKEFLALYGAFEKGHSSPLSELPIQYADFAAWQRKWLNGPVIAGQIRYWQERLKELKPLELSTDRTRPPVQSFRGASCPVRIPAKITEGLRKISRQEAATLFMGVSAAWKTLLHRYSGHDDISIGTPIAGRMRKETDGLIGLFVNTLLLRTDFSGEPTFLEVLRRECDTALGAFENQDVPFEQLVQMLQPERDLSRNPLFQIMLVMQNGPTEVLELPGLKVEARGIGNGTTKFDLLLSLEEAEGELIGWLEYSTDLFDEETIIRMIGNFQTLLTTIVEDPDRKVAELPLVSQEERRQLLFGWNDTDREYPPEPIHRLFEHQVERTPELIAVEAGDVKLTYRELNERANRLAHKLRHRGVGQEVRVGICLERSVEMVVGFLGILKAGGAYVPLDPGYPKDRLAYMISDGKVKVLLAEPHLESLFPQSGIDVIHPQHFGTGMNFESDAGENPRSGVSLDNLAYIIYTSGSTGQPKGVAMPHRALVNLVWWQLSDSRLGTGDRTVQFTSLSFDVSNQEIFSTWCSGGVLVLINESIRHDPEALWRLCAETGVRRVFLPFVALQQLANGAAMAGSVESPPFAEVITAGEQLQVTREIEAMFEKLHGCVLFNQYGPTETHIITSHRLGEVLHEWPALPPIGKPVNRTRIYLLDEQQQLVPPGVPGELYIAGDCLARGYLDQPELTAIKFVPDPFGPVPGGRLYRTGDIGRHLADGSIQFLGRKDHQVKIRGYRIEPGEVENALCAHPGVKEAAVMVREDEPGNKRLVAYVLAKREGDITCGELKQHLKEKLPDYMIPAAIVFLQALPLTPSGKIDRRRLPMPDGKRELEGKTEEPRSAIEQLTAGIWQEVLKLERVGVQDNFFELGGHSLLATRVISRVREVFGIEIPLRSLFEAPMLEAFCRRIEEARHGNRACRAEPVKPAAFDAAAPLSYAQERIWFLDRLDPGNATYNMPVALRVKGRIDPEIAAKVISEICRRHRVLRTTFEMRNGHLVQVVQDNRVPVLDLDSFGTLEPDEREREIREAVSREALQPFDLERGPLLRVKLIEVGESEHLLLVTMQHIIADAWSIGIMVKEFVCLYEAYRTGQKSPLPELSVQYADYAIWQRQWLSGEFLRGQIEYWRKRLKGLQPLELPTDRVRPATQTYRGATKRLKLNGDVVNKLWQISRCEGVTLFMALSATFKILLSRYTGSDDVTVGTPIANRTRKETEGLIGFFLNMLVLRTDLSGEPTFIELLRREREVALDAYGHQDVPFEQLVQELQPQRDLSRSPLFQVMFVMQHSPEEKLEIPGLEFETVEVENRTSKFDLTLALEPDGQELAGTFEYNTDLFESSTIERMARHFETLAVAAVEEPQRKISELNILTIEERRQLLGTWNNTSRDYPQICMHRLFEEQAAETPDSLAVAFEGSELSYRELNSRANQIARYLVRNGVRPEVRVAVCVDRSIEMVVSLLAIIKAGGVYVPLDPEHPIDRLKYVLQDACVTMLLTQESVSRVLLDSGFVHSDEAGIGSPTVVCLKDVTRSAATEGTNNLDCAVNLENIVYLIYTSGSTGRPKGVQISHRALANFLCSMKEKPGLTGLDRLLSVTTLSFDIAGLELWLPLISGAAVIVASSRSVADGRNLARDISESRATVLQATPATWRLLLESGWKGNPRLKVLCGGEAWPAELAASLLCSCGSVWNMYGPTETTIWSAVSQVAPGRSPVIGQPIANTQIYILDSRMQLLPVGVYGELYIGGDGLARGYLGRPELTAERFVPDPLGSRAGQRLYRTGDFARYLPDGTIQFLGRIDHQVKIRGYRIELGEIESALVTHPAVAQTVVVAREDSPGDKRLVAYIVVHRGQSCSTRELRSYLKGSLPDYMVPASFAVLDSLPLTASGKIDRKLLPAPAAGASGERKETVGDHTPTEALMIEIWREALKVDQIGIDDNFFDLGGHSLLAVPVVSKVQELFLVEVPLGSLFQAPTVSALSRLVDSELGKANGKSVPEKVLECSIKADVAEPVLRSTGQWVVGGNARPQARFRLFCFPHAGGGASLYRAWHEAAPASLEVIPIELPGRESRAHEHPISDFQTLIDELIAALSSECMEKEFAFFGHSFGAFVAFELTHAFSVRGMKSPRHLFVSAKSPSAMGPLSSPIWELSDAELISYMRAIGGTDDRFFEQPELVRLYLPALRADYKMDFAFTPSPKRRVTCPITAFVGDRDSRVNHHSMEGWAMHTEKTFSLNVLPGEHFYLREHGPALMKLIASALEN